MLRFMATYSVLVGVLELVEAEDEAAAINRLTVLLQQAGFNTAYEAANEQLPSAVPVESAAAAASGADSSRPEPVVPS